MRVVERARLVCRAERRCFWDREDDGWVWLKAERREGVLRIVVRSVVEREDAESEGGMKGPASGIAGAAGMLLF